MMKWLKWSLVALLSLIVGGFAVGYYFLQNFVADIYVPLFADNCAGCHGDDLSGTERGPDLLASDLAGGDSVHELIRSVGLAHDVNAAERIALHLSDVEIRGLAMYIGERRKGMRFAEFQFDKALSVPAEPLVSEEHDFTVERFASGMGTRPFSIAPLPDGSFLLTEKEKGLFVISADGELSGPIQGTPETGYSMNVRGVQMGLGWLLDVAPHPRFDENGWIYLHYTDFCQARCAMPDESGFTPKSMNRLDRGRIRDGRWVDVENIWRAEIEHYSLAADTGAGGRLAFDDEAHVFFSVGIRLDDPRYPQSLEVPYGKIHRMNDDGSVPEDNPLVLSGLVPADAPASLRSIWTYGHRSPQGLEWNPVRKRVWEAEMGPRGGDEINELHAGKNYGWPYHSLGLEYTGVAVARNEAHGIEFDVDSVEQTLVDFTPSPAISSFAFYRGDVFPGWRNDVLLGSLKGTSLFRLEFDGDEFVHRETLIDGLARIRDVEIGFDGFVYLVLENEAGGEVVRLVPKPGAIAG